MNKTVRSFALLLVFALALTGLSLAQDDTYRVHANILFDFYAGDVHIPAGDYVFNTSYGSHAVTLRNHDTGQTYTVLAVPADGDGLTSAVVEFDVVGDRHLLAALRTAGAGVEFHESSSLLASAPRRGSIAIVASLR